VPDAESPSDALLRLINGYQVSQAIHVAAALGLAGELADGPRAVGDLASVTDTHAGALHRLLRALAAVELVREEDDGTFGLTELGEALGGPAGSWAAFIGRTPHWTSWGHLLHSVRTGENAFRAVYGVDVWEYRAQRPEEAAIFDAAMTGSTRRVNAAVVAAHDFGRYGVIVDVGGGHGALLAGILARYRACAASCSTSRPWSREPKPTAWRSSPAASSNPFHRAATPTCSSTCCTTGRTRPRSRSSAPVAARPPPAPR
jgi:O-methyltransferase/methyltransferase family protein